MADDSDQVVEMRRANDGDVRPVDEFIKVDIRSGKKGRGRIVGHEMRRVHQCAVCDVRNWWSEGWIWFGSYQEIDDNKSIVKVCSNECRRRAKADGRVPRNAAIPDDLGGPYAKR